MREGSEGDIYIKWRVEGTEGLAWGTIGWPLLPDADAEHDALHDRAAARAAAPPALDRGLVPGRLPGTMGALFDALNGGENVLDRRRQPGARWR